MNVSEMKVLIESIIKLSETLDVLRKPDCTPTEIIAYNKVKHVFISCPK